MTRNPNSEEPLFDPTQVKVQFDRALPSIASELADLFEQSVPRLTKRDKKQISQEFSSGIDVIAPHITKLEEINGDPARLRESYENLEQILREYLRRFNVRMRPNEDAYECFIRQSERLTKVPYRLKRLMQFRLVQDGVQILVRNALAAPGGLKASNDLISEFGRKHLKEYLRFANTVDARLISYSNIDLRKATARNVTRVADLYRDIAAAFEHRLRLLVGLNFIAVGQPKPYADLRSFGYNQLFQAVESPQNPLIHFLSGAVNRHVRNALSHNGVSSSLSKGIVVFVDYSPGKKIETETIWTMSQFVRETKTLLLTILGAACVENEFMYLRSYCTVEVIRDMLRVRTEASGPDIIG